MADKCGFGCNFKKSMGQLSLGFKQQMYESKERKAKSYGFSSYSEWTKAAKKAEFKGAQQKGKKRLVEIEKRAAGQNIAGGPSNLSRGIKLFDEFMGSKPAAKRKKAPVSRRKTASRPQKRKTVSRPQKRKTAKRTVRSTSNPSNNVWDFGI